MEKRNKTWAKIEKKTKERIKRKKWIEREIWKQKKKRQNNETTNPG